MMNVCAPAGAVSPFEQLFGAQFFGGMTGDQGNPFKSSMLMMQPLCKSLARWQLELFGYNCRRTQALFALPMALARCRTPDALLAEQTRFVEVAVRQSTESAQRLGAIWLSAVVPALANGHRRPVERDYIRLPDDVVHSEPTTGQAGSLPCRGRAAA